MDQPNLIEYLDILQKKYKQSSLIYPCQQFKASWHISDSKDNYLIQNMEARIVTIYPGMVMEHFHWNEVNSW